MQLIVLKDYFQSTKEIDKDAERVIDVPEARELAKRFDYLEWKLQEKMSQEITLSFREMNKVENEERDDPVKKSLQGALYQLEKCAKKVLFDDKVDAMKELRYKVLNIAKTQDATNLQMQTLPNLNYFAKDSTYLIDIVNPRSQSEFLYFPQPIHYTKKEFIFLNMSLSQKFIS